MKNRKRVPITQQLKEAESAIVAKRGQSYLDTVYRSNGFEPAPNGDLLETLQRLGIVHFQLGRLSAELKPLPAQPAAPTAKASPAVSVSGKGLAAAASPAGNHPDLEVLRRLAPEIWPNEEVPSTRSDFARRAWFDHINLPLEGFDRASLEKEFARFGNRPHPTGGRRVLTAELQRKVDDFFRKKNKK